MEQITVSVHVNAPLEKAWEAFTNPDHMTKWNHASDDWHCPRARNDVRVGGTFYARMEATDGSEGFDFEGIYTEVIPGERLVYSMDDGRGVVVTFEREEEGRTKVTERFDPEIVHSAELQRAGWQSILDNYKHYLENR